MITILHAPGKTLSKAYQRGRDGQVRKVSYDRAALFQSAVSGFDDVDGLFRMQEWLQHRPDHCVIRALPGRWHPGEGRAVLRRIHASVELADDRGRFKKPARKGSAELWEQREIEAGRLRPVTVLPMFEEAATNWMLIDIDGLVAPAGIDWRADLAWAADFARMQLPPECRNVRCSYFATSSAGDLTKPDLGGDTIKLRLGFMLDLALTTAELKRWLGGVDGLDACTFNAIQVIYTAAPRFRSGLSDPIPVRLGMLDGERAVVPVPPIHVEQRIKREAFISLGPIRSAEGLGLLESPRLDAALERLAEAKGEAGGVRALLMNAMFEYATDVGRDHVDIDALAEALADVAAAYRSAGEIAGYGLESMIAWALERSPEAAAPRPHYPENGLPAEEATARLAQEMAAAVGSAVAWRAINVSAEGDLNVELVPPVVGIKAGAGSGKTGTALEQIAAIPGVEQLNIEIYVPDHRLAEEMAERVRTMVAAKRPAGGIDVNRELRAIVIRGRGAVDMHGTAMCAKSKIAEEIGKCGLNVMAHLCKLKGTNGEPTQYCEFAAQCRYLAQFRDTAPAIRILPHASMFVRRNKDLPAPDLIGIDESFWAGSLSMPELALDRLTEAGRWRVRLKKTKRAKNETPEEAAAEAFAQVKARKEAEDRKLDCEDFALRVRSAFEDGRDPRTVVTAEECSIVAAMEWGSRTVPDITPGMSHHAQVNAWRAWRHDECAKAGRFWDLLAAEHEYPDRPLQRIVLERDAPTHDGDRRHLLHLHHRRDLHLSNAPVILLDADLDATIAAKFWPAVRIVEIPVVQVAEVIQIVDKTAAMTWLLGGRDGDQQRADRRLAELRTTVMRLLGTGGLLVTYKKALEQLTLPPAIDTLHLGNLRGRDGYKHHDRIVVCGRLEPHTHALEAMARAMFGDEAEPLVTVAAGVHGGTRYPQEQRRYRMAGGVAGTAVKVSVHPDPRAQALLEQVRERELEQAVARLRLVHRDRPAVVYLLTNLPLNLDVTTLTTWNALARDREAEACRRWDGLWLCSASERAKAAPDLWATARAAEHDRQRKGYPESSNKDSRGDWVPFPHYPAWGSTSLNRDRLTLVAYRYPGQRGSAHQALVPGELWCQDTARAYLEPVTGPVAGVTIVRTVYREPIVDPGDPEPLVVPITVNAPCHVLDVSAAWCFSGHKAERWTLPGGKNVLAPPAVRRWALALRPPDRPTSFAGCAP